MSKGFSGGISILAGLIGAYTLAGYMCQPHLESMDVVKGEAAYVEQYNGPKPAEALEHSLETLNIIRESNPNYEEDFQALESEIRQYQGALSGIDNELLYSPVLDDVSSRLETFADEHTKDGWLLLLGSGACVASILNGVDALKEYN